MATKSQAPGPNPTTAPPGKQARSRKAPPTQNVSAQANVGRAGSAGGIVLEKSVIGKTTAASSPKTDTTQSTVPEASPSTIKPRRKPRKLNKDTTSGLAQNAKTLTRTNVDTDTTANTELEELKSRVRGLEAKVEQLYSSADARGARSPRRRGKGRKGSSSTQVPTISTTANSVTKVQELGDEEEEADEELVRLEGELEVARQDLEAYRPRNRRTISQDTDDVEEIHRDGVGLEDTATNTNRHVTLSGSYRIPLPTNVSMDDVRNIQSGVSAAQNVARSFLEQRRVAAASREQQNPPSQPTSASNRSTKASNPKSISSSMEIAVASDGQDGKQSWGDWIGGYSMAITRAVKNIEHVAAVESQKVGLGGASKGPAQTARGPSASTSKKSAGGKRPGAKTKLSSEQVQGLMS